MAARIISSPSMGNQMAESGDMGALQKYLGMKAAKKGQYSAAWSILQPDSAGQADEIKKQKAKAEGERVIKAAEDYYFKGKLYKGFPGGIVDEAEAMFSPNSPYARYKKFVKANRVRLARAAGDVGNLAVQEQTAAQGILPNALFDRNSAEEMFRMARVGFGLEERDYSQL
jgi:hypothetical protein